MEKRILSVLLSVCMLVCLVPVVHVSAEGNCVYMDKSMLYDIMLKNCSIASPYSPHTVKQNKEFDELIVLDKIPADVVGSCFALNRAHTVQGFIRGNVLNIAPTEPGKKVALSEKDTKSFFADLTLSKMDLSRLDVSRVEDMANMFAGCINLVELNVNNWDTANVKDMVRMFQRCSKLTRLDLRNFCTSNVENMGEMFSNCENLEEILLGDKFSTDKVKCRWDIISGCPKLNALDYINRFKFEFILSNFKFKYWIKSKSFAEQNIAQFKVSKSVPEGVVTYPLGFDGADVVGYVQTEKDEKGENIKTACIAPLVVGRSIYLPDYCAFLFEYSKFKSIDLSLVDASKVENMWLMFNNCKNLESLNLRGFNTSNATFMRSMFSYCPNLKNLGLTGFVTSKVSDMSNMFYGCENLENLDLTGFVTSNVRDMSNMFYGCKKLKELDLSNFDTGAVISFHGMFENCYELERIIWGKKFSINKGVFEFPDFLYNIFCCCHKLDISEFKDKFKMIYCVPIIYSEQTRYIDTSTLPSVVKIDKLKKIWDQITQEVHYLYFDKYGRFAGWK